MVEEEVDDDDEEDEDGFEEDSVSSLGFAPFPFVFGFNFLLILLRGAGRDSRLCEAAPCCLSICLCVRVMFLCVADRDSKSGEVETANTEAKEPTSCFF